MQGDMVTQGKRIKHFREEGNLKQEELSKLLGMSQSNYSRIENDEVKASDEVLDSLATIFKVDKEALINPDSAVNFNNCNQAFYKHNTVHNYSISDELKQLYEDKIRLLEEKIAWLEKR